MTYSARFVGIRTLKNQGFTNATSEFMIKMRPDPRD